MKMDEAKANAAPDAAAKKKGKSPAAAKASKRREVYVYAGEDLPAANLRRGTRFFGTLEDVKKYLAPALGKYPQIAGQLKKEDTNGNANPRN
jgi:hypothetical protein